MISNERDMDMIRSLLLEIEAGKTIFEVYTIDDARLLELDESKAVTPEEAARLDHHLDLLQDGGFVEFRRLSGGVWSVQRLTWQGHEFLDTVRDGEVWRKTKAGLKRAGNSSFALLFEVAKAAAKHEAGVRLGMKFD